MKYVYEKEISEKLKHIKSGKMHFLYKGNKSSSKMRYQYDSSFVSYTTTLKDTGEQVTNYVARNISKDDLKNIIPLKRVSNTSGLKYNLGHDAKKAKQKGETTRLEEWICYNLVDLSMNGELSNSLTSVFGQIFDYQVPLKCSSKDPCGQVQGV